MRTCTSIVSDTSTTELIEPSGTITKRELNELLDKLSNCKAEALCVMGSMPPGCPENTYADIYERVSGKHTLCLIDSVVGLGPLLKQIATSQRQDRGGPTILKCNASELCRLAGVKKSLSGEAHGIQQDELVQAVTSFLRKYVDARHALTAIAITDGSHPSYMAVMPVSSSETEFRLFQLPITSLNKEETVERSSSNSSWGHWSSELQTQQATKATSQTELSATKVYPIGAGDAVAAGTLAAWVCLTGRPRSSSSSRSLRQPAQEEDRMHPDIQAALAGNESPTTRAILTSFSFGLACGTASCLNQENSVVGVEELLKIFEKAERPMFVSTHSIL